MNIRAVASGGGGRVGRPGGLAAKRGRQARAGAMRAVGRRVAATDTSIEHRRKHGPPSPPPCIRIYTELRRVRHVKPGDQDEGDANQCGRWQDIPAHHHRLQITRRASHRIEAQGLGRGHNYGQCCHPAKWAGGGVWRTSSLGSGGRRSRPRRSRRRRCYCHRCRCPRRRHFLLVSGGGAVGGRCVNPSLSRVDQCCLQRLPLRIECREHPVCG